MKPMLLLAAALGLGPVAVALAQEGAGAAGKPDLAKAQTIVNQVCAACHGADGNSPTPANPSLAGQPADYIALQLAHFKAGIRTNAVMQGMAATLSPEDMRALGAFFARQTPKLGTAKDAELARAGQKLFRGGAAADGIPACAGCHSPDGAGIPKNFPRLAGQSPDYIHAQLRAFHAGERGADKEGKDANGKVMAAIAFKMNDEQMRAIAEYVAGLH